MKRPSLLFAWCVAPLVLVAGDRFPAIPPEVWAIKDGAATSGKGALVLEERHTFEGFWIRFRVVSEAGKSHVRLPRSMRLKELEGRISYPDGTSVRFNTEKDLGTAVEKVGNNRIETQVMIPPGLTGDCVVDLWLPGFETDGLKFVTKSLGWVTRDILRPVPIRKYAIDVSQAAGSFAYIPGRGLAPRITETRYGRMLEFSDLPALEEVPFGLGLAVDTPRLVFFSQPNDLVLSLDKGPDYFWQALADRYFRRTYAEWAKKGRAYKALSEELRRGLSTHPHEAARDLLARLNTAVLNLDHLTLEERARLGKRAEEEVNSLDLNAAADSRRTSAKGFQHLFVQILMDHGVFPKLGLVCDRDAWIFRYDILTPYQFTDVLVGLESPDRGILWLDPGNRRVEPGTVIPNYQGTSGLILDSRTWAIQRHTFGREVALPNQAGWTFSLDLGADRDRISTSFTGTGIPALEGRTPYWPLAGEEQNKRLKATYASEVKSLQIQKAEVVNAQVPGAPFTWRIEGIRESEEGLRRSVNPFPGMELPVQVPGSWPPFRRQPIVFPYPMTHRAVSKILLPAGWAAGPLPDFQKQNFFGSISWWMSSRDAGDRTEVEVVFSADLRQPFGPSSRYEELQEFVGWLEECARRALAVTPRPGH